MGKRALQVLSRRNPRAAVFWRRVNQRYPTSQVLLWLNKGVAVVLMPRKFLTGTGTLIDQLIPIQSGARPDQVVTEFGKNGVLCERFHDRASQHDVSAEYNFIRPSDARLVLGHPS